MLSTLVYDFDTAEYNDDWSSTYHTGRNNLAIGLLDLSDLTQEVPETGLCDNGIRCKDAHAVKFWRWVGVGWQVAPDDLVFLKTACISFSSAVPLHSFQVSIQIKSTVNSKSSLSDSSTAC